MRRFLPLVPFLLVACATVPPALPAAAPLTNPTAAPAATSAPQATPSQTVASPSTTSPTPSVAPVSSATPTPAVPAKVSFRTEVAPILARSCAGCHAPGKQAVRDLAVFDDAGAVRYDTIAADINSVIAETQSGGMPRGGRPELSAAEVELLKRWRDDGMPAE